MAVNSSTELKTSTQSSISLSTIWQSLTAPAETVTGENRRKASTLAALMVVFMPLAIVTIFITPIARWLTTGVFTPPSFTLMLALVIVISAYVLSRSKYYDFGSYLVVAVPFIAVLGTILASTTPANVTGLFFVAVSIVLSSLLIDARSTVVTGLIAVGVIVVSYVHPNVEQEFPWTIVMFMAIITGVMASMSAVRDGYVRSLETARKELQEHVEEVERARERAERSDQVKSAFLASMSHELRTPLNAVINFTTFIIDGDLGPINAEQTDLLNQVVTSATHLLDLINDVLDMSKIEAGSLRLFVENDVSLNSILDNAIATSRILILNKPVQLETTIEGNLPLIAGDKQRILQILLNILSNACKFTQEGSIKVTASRTSDEIRVSVTDTGPGIAVADQALVFEAFKQTNTGLRHGGGTGLGMPIAKNLTEAHGGRLWLESTPGKGSTFHITLPIKSQLAPTFAA